ncbi:testis-expressed protein 2 isoform X2 [Ischnura elegans]|uniref:testis-expressed protein 2 isoform X2 n=1 Tax=Ischnura elegans TaxID=197161 RepID=UPI001ED8AA6F|nr:testis-expressed protein 2 isoform X2 [Ischnura elegans]
MDLSQSKGKPITTSVPTFAIRFHAEDEELEEVYSCSQESEAAASEKTELREEDESSRASTPSSSSITISHHVLGGSSREISPSKECPPKLGKRSSSVDSVGSAAAAGAGTCSSSVSDTWNIFQELRGKIVKRVEETLSKTDRSGKKLGPGSMLPSSRGSQENSSVSDSEEACGPVNPGDEALAKELGRLASEGDPPLTPELEDKDETPLANTEVTFFVGDMETKAEESSQEDRFPRKIYELRKRISQQVAADSQDQQEDPGVSGSTSHPVSAQPIIPSMSSLFARWERKQQEEDDDVDEEFEVLGADCAEEAEEVKEEIPLSAGEGSNGSHSSVHQWPPHSLSTFNRQNATPINSWFGWSTPTLFVIVSMISLGPFILPTLLFGMFLGIGLSIPVGLLVHWWYYGSWLPTSGNDSTMREAFAVPDFGKLPILEVPAAKEYQPLPRYEGWMNQYPHEYDPSTYNVGATKPTLVRLEGHLLRLSYTTTKIPRRAMWYEPATLRAPICHWVDYNIKNCPIVLLPDGLARKRLWSKKYPICIVLRKGSVVSTTFASVDGEKESGTTPTDGSEGNKDTEESAMEKEVYSKDSDDDGENSIASSANYPTEVPERMSGFREEDEWSVDEEENICPVGGELMKVHGKRLYLFARTDREKDDWFRRFVSSSKSRANRADEEIFANDFVTDQFTPDDNNPDGNGFQRWAESSNVTDAEFQRFISRFLNKVNRFRRHLAPARSVSKLSSIVSKSRSRIHVFSKRNSSNSASQGSDSVSGPSTPSHAGPSKRSVDAGEEAGSESVEALSEDDKELLLASLKGVSSDVVWANAFLARVLFDVLRDRYWINQIQDKIQRKLDTIKLPNFVEHLLVTELDLGHSVPIIHRASPPVQDERGIWVDLDVTYEGQACLTLETRLNLMRLKKGATNGSTDVPEQQSPTEKDSGRSPMFYSDVEDSAESSSDEEINPSHADESHGTPTSKKKILQMVDKIASSKYFQQATEYKYIKRAMEGVSNTRLVLSVELKGAVGTLAVNIPPPPSDRLWYGFRTNPRLWLTARPKLGERQVNITHITNLIESKLCFVIQKIFVLPNMDDLIIPVMSTQLPQ